jgi:chromosome segregation ATPase
VPIFADPIEWDNHRSYESLTIVTHDGESYTSKCNVGPGIDITNTRYWAKTGAYNAQVEQYKNEVKDLSSQVNGFASDNAEFREKIDQYDKDNAAMKNTVAANNARVDALAERMTTAETEIDGLQATTAQHTTDLANLHAKDEELQRQITSNDNDIAALQAKDTEQDSRMNGIDTKLKSHDASIAQNTADIAKNTKNIQDNAANIAKNAHELADHAAKLTDHEGRLTAQHEEITANHQAIERLTSVTDGLRSDLTEDEAKIESNRDAIAHIQEKDVQQDGRLDKLEECCDQAKAHFTQLDTKTDNTNTALTAEIDRAKAAELANGKLIAKNAAELANHATQLADHEGRISTLESDNTTNKQDIADIKAKNAAQDTAISGNTDSITHLENDKADNTALGDYVTKTEFNADQKRQDDIVGDWATAHPGQTISECATSQENELAKNAAELATHATELADHETRISTLESDTTSKQDIEDIKAKNAQQDTAISDITDSITHLETDKADKTALGDYVTKTEFNADQKRQDDIVGDWATAHPGQTIAECVTSQETELAEHAASIAKLENDKVAVDGLFQTSVEFPSVEITKMSTGVAYVEDASVVICDIDLPFLRKETTSAPATVTVNSPLNAEVVYFDGTTETIRGSAVSVRGEFGAGFVQLTAIISTTSIPNIEVGKPFVLRIPLSVTVSTTVS